MGSLARVSDSAWVRFLNSLAAFVLVFGFVLGLMEYLDVQTLKAPRRML